MATINLTPSESRLLNIVILEMKNMPEVDYEVVAQKVGIKYAKNAKTSFKKVWDKLKAGANGATDGDDDDAEAIDNMAVKTSSPKKSTTKKAPISKKAPVVKKGIAKAVGAKKASEGGPKAKVASRKTKKQKEEEDAAAVAAAEAEADQEDNEDEDMEEDNEDGKSPNFIVSNDKASSSDLVTAGVAESVQSVHSLESAADGVIEAADNLMNDEYECYIRGMTMEDWLTWKAEIGYTFNLI